MSPKEVEGRVFLIGWLFQNGLYEVLVQRAGQSVKKALIADDRPQNHRSTDPTNANLVRLEAEILRQAHRLGAARPEHFCGFHRTHPRV
jgi:hypothetical protein